MTRRSARVFGDLDPMVSHGCMHSREIRARKGPLGDGFEFSGGPSVTPRDRWGFFAAIKSSDCTSTSPMATVPRFQVWEMFPIYEGLSGVPGVLIDLQKKRCTKLPCRIECEGELVRPATRLCDCMQVGIETAEVESDDLWASIELERSEHGTRNESVAKLL